MRVVTYGLERASGQRYPRVRALAEQVGHSLAEKRPTGAFSKPERFEKGLSESFISPVGRKTVL